MLFNSSKNELICVLDFSLARRSLQVYLAEYILLEDVRPSLPSGILILSDAYISRCRYSVCSLTIFLTTFWGCYRVSFRVARRRAFALQNRKRTPRGNPEAPCQGSALICVCALSCSKLAVVEVTKVSIAFVERTLRIRAERPKALRGVVWKWFINVIIV